MNRTETGEIFGEEIVQRLGHTLNKEAGNKAAARHAEGEKLNKDRGCLLDGHRTKNGADNLANLVEEDTGADFLNTTASSSAAATWVDMGLRVAQKL